MPPYGTISKLPCFNKGQGCWHAIDLVLWSVDLSCRTPLPLKKVLFWYLLNDDGIYSPKSRIPALFSELLVLSQLYELWTFPSTCPRFLCKEIRISLLCSGLFGSWPSTYSITLSCFLYWNSRRAECFENIWPANSALYLIIQLSSIVWNIHIWCDVTQRRRFGTAEEGKRWKWNAKRCGPECGRRMYKNMLWSEFNWGAFHVSLFYPLQLGHCPGKTCHGISHFLDFSSLPFCFLPDLFLTVMAHECYHLTALPAMILLKKWPWE